MWSGRFLWTRGKERGGMSMARSGPSFTRAQIATLKFKPGEKKKKTSRLTRAQATTMYGRREQALSEVWPRPIWQEVERLWFFQKLIKIITLLIREIKVINHALNYGVSCTPLIREREAEHLSFRMGSHVMLIIFMQFGNVVKIMFYKK